MVNRLQAVISKDRDDALKLIFEWVKTGVIGLVEFKMLINRVKEI